MSASKTLDAAAAMALMDDSTELYQEIAQAYLQEIAELWPSLDGLLRQAQLSDAMRTLHTFKGLSLTVGANLLSEVCRDCELQCKSLQQGHRTLDDGTRASMQQALEGAVAQTQLALLAVLAALDGGVQPKPDAASGSIPDLLADLHGLRALLAGSDMQALDRHAGLVLRYPAQREVLLSLSQAIKIFDFARAVVQCDELIRILTTISR